MRVTITRRSTAALALIAGIALSQASALQASADDYPIEWQSPSTATLEYGQYWMFTAVYQPFLDPGEYAVESTGTPGSFTPEASRYCDTACRITVSSPYESAVLPAGSYSFTASYDHARGADLIEHSAETPTSATLTITPAKLGLELRVLADPSNSDAAIVTAKFTGRFVDEYSSSFFPGAASSPAGIWHISLKDADGEIATERSIERAAGDDVLATSFYWADAEPGEQYTASASFEPSGASANNFAVTPAAEFSYTAPSSQRPVPTSSATGSPDAALPEATGFGLPLWSIVVAVALILGLATLLTILSVRLSRRPAPAGGEVSA